MRFTRPLSNDELAKLYRSESLACASQMFLRNQIDAECVRVSRRLFTASPSGDFVGVFDEAGLRLLAYFSFSGVLVLGPGDAEDGEALAPYARAEGAGFRLLIGAREASLGLLEALRGDGPRVLLDRSQPFLAITDAKLTEDEAEFRLANKKDLEWLPGANLRLNEEDLGIEPRTVNPRLLRRRIKERIKDEVTFVLDCEGKAACKLEIGNRGPAGALIEGVFTLPEFRGRGLARRLVSGVAHRYLQTLPAVGLHCARGNAPALRAYVAAGLREVEDLRLVRLRW